MNNSPNNSLLCHATLEDVSRILEIVIDAARSSGMEEKNVWKLETSLDEACTNIVSYGYKDREDGVISVHWETNGKRFIVTLEDQGIAFDQTTPTNPDFTCDICQRKVGGLGRFIMSQFLDDMSYTRIQNGNRLILVKNLHSESEQPAESLASQG